MQSLFLREGGGGLGVWGRGSEEGDRKKWGERAEHESACIGCHAAQFSSASSLHSLGWQMHCLFACDVYGITYLPHISCICSWYWQ